MVIAQEESMVRSFVFALAVLTAGTGAFAADYGARVVDERLAVAPGLWRGHFSGGINVAPYNQDIAVAWNEQVAFFPDDGSCRRWITSQKRLFATYTGHKGCLRIR